MDAGLIYACVMSTLSVFCAGFFFGRRTEAGYWRLKAEGDTAVCSGGKFFYVVNHGDERRGADVAMLTKIVADQERGP